MVDSPDATRSGHLRAAGVTDDLDPPITPDERALAEIGCRAAWEAHYRFGLPWPRAMDEEQQHLGIVEMVAALRAVKEAERQSNSS